MRLYIYSTLRVYIYHPRKTAAFFVGGGVGGGEERGEWGARACSSSRVSNKFFLRLLRTNKAPAKQAELFILSSTARPCRKPPRLAVLIFSLVRIQTSFLHSTPSLLLLKKTEILRSHISELEDVYFSGRAMPRTTSTAAANSPDCFVLYHFSKLACRRFFASSRSCFASGFRIYLCNFPEEI